ncbi:MAG: reverse transcriptase domain-containing protein [Candidatus Methanomethylophilaceae archaeon]|jgi:hypothetical protein
MSLLRKLSEPDTISSFISKKRDAQKIPQQELDETLKLLEDPETERILRELSSGDHVFPVPYRVEISKINSSKKRVVYTFGRHEKAALKLLGFLLRDYDHIFSDNLYSYRSSTGSRDAVRRLHRLKDLDSMFVMKTDIHDYFNSIDVEILLADLRRVLVDDEPLYGVFENFLDDDRSIWKGDIVHGPRGAMAGMPVAPFLANLYLDGLDRLFDGSGIIYCRYADDILLAADSEQELSDARETLCDFIRGRKLEINPDKDAYFQPGEPFDFLGFRISENSIDLCPNTVKKIKGKISRRCRSSRRWYLDNGLTPEKGIKGAITIMNRKFYGYGDSGELSWDLWYLPVLTTDSSLRIIDRYFEEELRSIPTGKHNRRNYKITSYELLQECGFRPLVRRYHEIREMDGGTPPDSDRRRD